MKKHEILYDWLHSHITTMADSEIAERFSEGLAKERQNNFSRLAEELRLHSAELVKAKASRLHTGNWRALWHSFSQFAEDFSDFPDLAAKKVQLTIIIANKLASDQVSLDLNIIDEFLFEIRDLEISPPLNWFVWQNSRSLVDSVVVVSCADVPALAADIPATNISPELGFHFLAALIRLPDITSKHAALIRKTTPSISDKAVDAFARLALVSDGKAVHQPRQYTAIPQIFDRDAVKAGIAYHQFNDIFDVLSEYNSRSEILTKYLTLYHVIENFMFKLPIVRLERRKNGGMFSIRDFRNMYSKVNDTEADAINKAILKLLDYEISPGHTFKSRVISIWNKLLPANAPAGRAAEIQNVLGALGLTERDIALTHAQFRLNLGANLARVIYGIRNAVVHNKATEFHLTYATLTSAFCLIIEEFLVPVLEEICFSLISNKNDYVWYSREHLVLYG